MSQLKVWIDTDGQADSLWGLILAKDYLEVQAISVCIGKNTNIEHSVQNTSVFAAMAGLRCPIFKGCDRTVLNKDKPEWKRFAPDGKCGMKAPAKGLPVQEDAPWDKLYEAAKLAQGDFTILCFGPLTNIALTIYKYPDFAQYVKKIAFVGGSYDFGDYTSVVEINMATDPEAAATVFESGIRLEMYGYNAMLKSALTNGEIGKVVNGANGPFTTAFAMCGMAHKPNSPIYYGPALAVMGLAKPDSVTKERYNVFVETKSSVCRGRTTPLNMYTPIGYAKDTLVAMDLDKEQYINILKESLAAREAL